MSIIRGDSSLFQIAITDDTGAAYDLTGCSVWVTMKRSTHESDARAVYQHEMAIDGTGAATVTDGLTLQSTAAAGVVVDEITPAESSLFRPGTYYVDVQVMDADGRIWTPILNAPETVVGDLTRAITAPA